MHHESDGTLRWFAVLGALGGMLLYKKTISPFLVKYTSFVLIKLFCLLGKSVKFLCAPLAKAAGIMKKTAGKARKGVSRQAKGTGRLVKKKLTFLVKMLKMTI